MKRLMILVAVAFGVIGIRVVGQETVQNPHGKLKWECSDCHTTESWSAVKPKANFKHDDTGFPLQGAHETVACVDCHKDMKLSNVGSACVDCHTDIHQAQFGHSCEDCHLPINWQNQENVLSLHASRGFPLIGVHSITDCAACHINQQHGEFAGTSMDCGGCHRDDFMATNNPNHALAGFKLDCRPCHQAVTTNWKNANYQHPVTFALHGAHLSVECNGCHISTYAGTPADCNGCHAQAYQAATNPPHANLGFPTDCTMCHNDVQWQGATFNHMQITGFDLVGAHASLRCSDCHVNNQYTGLATDCYGCHQANFEAATNPNHITNNFGHDCTVCHNNTAWSPATVDHTQLGFPLTGAHASLQCIACHSSGYQNTPVNCYDCHQTDFNNASDPAHATNNFSHDCTQCHTTTGWSPATFDHAGTRFPLTGAHVTLQCIACHANGYQNTPFDCYSCHQSNYEGVSDPNHVTNNFNHDCTQCHNTAAWNPATFDHANTRFPLTGAHVSLQCIACHANGYQNTPFDCYSCHQSNYEAVADPNHVQLNFSHDCSQCHTTSGWDPATFDHSQSPFPLTGAHTSVPCASCHANGYQNTPTDCFSCHETDFNGVSDPNHVTNNFNHDCTQCHNTAAWNPATFDHSQTRFPLTGAHVSLQCIACHANGYQNTPYDCYSCHEADYNRAEGHVANNFPHDCTQCHNTTRWDDGVFNHNNSPFPLTGAHANLQCIACHANGYQNTPSDCYSCHQSNYEGVSDPNHVQLNFNHDCSQCHTTDGWDPATFDHSQSPFPLTGAHNSVPCASCHANGYQNTPTDCFSCHETDFNGVSDPNHISNNFNHDCTQCHTTSGWSPASFDHANTHFPLTGAHVSLQCIACHANGYQNTPYDCYSCHQSNYDGVSDPNHVTNNFDHDCTQCHNTSAWTPATFDHANTHFPLTGAHVSLQCIACHANGYQNTPYDCYSCHQSNYEGVSDPNHVQLNFSHDCSQCHSTSAWDPATFDHSQTPFPLTGVHMSVPCQSCHANGYQNTPTDCYACHVTDFNGAGNPNHSGLGFPTDCTMCHTTAGWTPSSFEHDAQYFPIFSGEHRGRWSNCSTCHLIPNDFGSFSCTATCHPRSNTDQQHQSVPGYVYDSQACYSCHPNGGGGGLLRGK